MLTNDKTQAGTIMKKLLSILFTAALFAAAGCLATYVLIAYVAPIVIGATVFGNSLNTVAGVFNIPNWASVMLFLTLAPAFLFWIIRWFLPQWRRRWLAILIIIAAGVYEASSVFVTHEAEFAVIANSTFSHIQKICLPIKDVDPTKTAWFSTTGDPLLFYTHTSSNSWRFIRAYPGAHDSMTGVELQPVTPLIRQTWEAERQTESNSELSAEENAAKKAVQIQLQAAQYSLRIERDKHVLDVQNCLNGLIQELESKALSLSALGDTSDKTEPQRLVNEAMRQLDDTKQELAGAVKSSGNGTPVDLTGLQKTAQTALQKADLAQQQLRTMVTDPSASKKIAAEVTTDGSVQEKKETAPAESRERMFVDSNSPSVTVRLRNSTRFTVLVSFSSSKYNHVWPASDRAFVVSPGQTFVASLAGFSGEPIYYTASARENPSLQWGKCTCMSEEEASPIGFCGFADPPMLTLTEPE
jgi:hypothetical protein